MMKNRPNFCSHHSYTTIIMIKRYILLIVTVRRCVKPLRREREIIIDTHRKLYRPPKIRANFPFYNIPILHMLFLSPPGGIN